MSLFGGIISGAMMGGGQAFQEQARDEELRRERREEREWRTRLEEAREKAAADRAVALENLRHSNNMALKKYEISDEYIQGVIGQAQKKKQAEIDIENDPKNVDAAIAKTTKLEEAKGYDLSPGQQRFVGGRKVAENTRSTTAELYDRLYRDGVRGDGKKGDLDKLPEVDRRALTILDAEAKELDKAIIKAQSDSMYDPESPGIKQLNERLQGVRAQQRSILEKHGFVQGEGKPAAPQGPNWGSISEGQRGAIVERMRGLSGDKLTQAIKEAESLGMPLDVLQQFKAEKPSGDKPTGAIAGNQKPDFAEPPKLSDEDLKLQQEIDKRRERQEASKARAAEIKAITSDRIRSMSAEEAQRILDTYGTELSGKQRAALNARVR